MRRDEPYVLELTSACTSTRIGREPSTEHSTADPGAFDGRSARNNFDGLGTGRSHLEHAELADRAEPVLHRANDAVRVMPLPFEVQHRVHDVLEGFGAREASVL